MQTIGTASFLIAAVKLVERTGFQPIAAPIGQTEHFGCNRFYILPI